MLCVGNYAVLLLVIGATAQADISDRGYLVDSKPNWVVERQYDIGRSPTHSQAVQYLLIDQQHRLFSGANKPPPQYFNRFAMRLLNRAGLSMNSQLKITYNPAYQTLHLHSLKVIRNGTVRELANAVYVRMVQQEEQLSLDIHDGKITAVLIPEDIRVGDIVDYSYTIEGRNPIFGAMHFGTSRLNYSAPVDKLALRILTDSNRFVFRSSGAELKLDERRLQDMNEYSLLHTNVAAVIDDGETSPEYSPFAWLEYSEYENWQAVNQWAAVLYADNQADNDEAAALARKLKQQSSGEADYIARALFFVQNEIRYLGLEFGENSHRPRLAREVLKKRYGDCKDKSLLLTTLLQLQGIRAWPALVSTSYRHGIKRSLPSPGTFDHVITLVEFMGKKYWLDATRLYQAGGLDYLGYSDYGFALVVGHRNKNLQRMYPEPPNISSIDVTEDIIATDFNKPVILKVESVYQFNAAEFQRFKFQNMSLESINRSYLEYYSRFYDDISVEAMPEIEDDKHRNRCTIRQTYRINDYWNHKDSLVHSTIYNLSYLDTLKAPKVRQRKTPYHLGTPRQITSVFRLHYPKKVSLKFDINPVTIENSALRYSYQDDFDGDVFTHTSSLLLKQKDVALLDMDNFMSSLKEIRKDWKYTLSVVNPDTSPGYSDSQSLKKARTNM
jgi:hypothetical protein